MLRDEVNKALQVVRDGGVILYPTDTIWGLGCDASNEEAIRKIFSLKGRAENKSLIVLLDNAGRLPSYVAEVPDLAYDLIDYAEKPLTIIFSGARNMAPGAIHADGSAAIRVTDHPFCRDLIQRMRKPLVSTSANFSGEPAPACFADIPAALISGVDYVVNLEQDDPAPKEASTIMRLENDGRFSFIRR